MRVRVTVEGSGDREGSRWKCRSVRVTSVLGKAATGQCHAQRKLEAGSVVI